jgi:hypothetical protein
MSDIKRGKKITKKKEKNFFHSLIQKPNPSISANAKTFTKQGDQFSITPSKFSHNLQFGKISQSTYLEITLIFKQAHNSILLQFFEKDMPFCGG